MDSILLAVIVGQPVKVRVFVTLCAPKVIKVLTKYHIASPNKTRKTKNMKPRINFLYHGRSVNRSIPYHENYIYNKFFKYVVRIYGSAP